MENKEFSYQTLIERLKNTLPVPENPEALTQSVIERIERIEANRLKSKIMYITGWLSGAAATVLICLLIHITIQPPVSFSMETKTLPIFPEQVNHEIKMPAKGKSMSEKKEIITFVISEKIKLNNKKEQLFVLLQENINY
jgi:hypothetical protein